MQGYIDKSDKMKRTCADAISLVQPTLEVGRGSDEHIHKKSANEHIHYHYYFNGANINAPLQFH